MRNDPCNSDDVIDSRDVIARIEELEGEIGAEGFEDVNGGEIKDELAALKAFAKEAEDYAPDWQYGATLIRDSFFVEYCRDLVADIGDLPRDLPGYLAIDWEKTADNLRVDYTSVEFDGVTYWVR